MWPPGSISAPGLRTTALGNIIAYKVSKGNYVSAAVTALYMIKVALRRSAQTRRKINQAERVACDS